ncbi:hypothetical protein B0H15DRAFT_935377 [Mycena belliarum]|uniref:Uncharacterized protein n=1 Tax=Mycena belliarum TaxID=1033014 RepID=A0AAD6TPP7_9AGAR|nr:hypothetical protein B0H15DRAFT_935377 [Mycena belliae]
MALRYVFVRLYEGRFGELGAEARGSTGRTGRECGRGTEWCVGWQRDTEAGAAALWFVWFFEGWDTLRAEPEPAWRALMALLLLLVVVRFRYHSTLCPPHQYTVPLLPSVLSEMHDGEGEGAAADYGHRPPQPVHLALVLASPSTTCAPAFLLPLALDCTLPAIHPLVLRAPVSASALCAPPEIFISTSCLSRVLSIFVASLAPLPSRFVSSVVPCRLGSISGSSSSPSRPRPSPGPSRLLPAPPARLLFFARVQAGGRTGALPSLARDRREAGERWVAGGGPGPRRRTSSSKNARPAVRFEAQLPAYPVSAPPAADADSAAVTSGTSASTKAAQTGLSAAEVDAARAVPFVATDLDADVKMHDDALGAASHRARHRAGRCTPPGGLERDDFIAAARPVYMRIAEHHSPSTFFARILCPPSAADSIHTPIPPPPPESTTGEEGMRAGWLPHGACFLPRAVLHQAGHTQVEVHVDGAVAGNGSFEAQFGGREEDTYVSETVGEGRRSWPEWDAPLWAGHRFADDEGCEACDGVQDVVFTGATDPRHGMAWHHYEYAGRPLPQRNRTLGLATYYISGHLLGRNTFEGSWQMVMQDVLVPSLGGIVCFARGEE